MDYLQSITQLSNFNNSIEKIQNNESKKKENIDFLSILKETVNDLNQSQKKADEASASIATGTVKDLHQAAITIDKAEINMKMMLEIRNKALNAYKELLRTQV